MKISYTNENSKYTLTNIHGCMIREGMTNGEKKKGAFPKRGRNKIKMACTWFPSWNIIKLRFDTSTYALQQETNISNIHIVMSNSNLAAKLPPNHNLVISLEN